MKWVTVAAWSCLGYLWTLSVSASTPWKHSLIHLLPCHPTSSHPSKQFWCTSLCPLNFCISLHVFSFIFFLFLLAIITGFPIFHYFLLITFHSYRSYCQFHCLVFPHLLLIRLSVIYCFPLQTHSHTHSHRRRVDLERLGASGTVIGAWCRLTWGEVTVWSDTWSSWVKYLWGESTFLWPYHHFTLKHKSL